MGRCGGTDYPWMTKTSLGLGLVLFLFGAIGAKIAFVVSGGATSGWERALFFNVERLGIALVLFSPIISGVVLPLTEQMVDADPRFLNTDETLILELGYARCPALIDCHNRISWDVGPDDATVVIVGEAPGADNLDTGRWRGNNWTGMSYTTRHPGRRVRETMAAADYELDVFYTNAIKYFPSDGEELDHAPTAAEKANCYDYLVPELGAVDPDVVVPAGCHTTESVPALDDASLDGSLDTVLDPVGSERFGYTVIPLLHPLYRDMWLSHLSYELEEYLADLEVLLSE